MKSNITAEEFFRKKVKELHPDKKEVTLARELITAEQGLRWAHEFHNIKLEESTVDQSGYKVVAHKSGGFTVKKKGMLLKSVLATKEDAETHKNNLIKTENALREKFSTNK